MPYSYYQAVRFIGMLGFILLAYFSNQQNNKIEVIVYISLALLFQPFIKVALGRTVWNIVDVIVSAGLIISLFVKPKKAWLSTKQKPGFIIPCGREDLPGIALQI